MSLQDGAWAALKRVQRVLRLRLRCLFKAHAWVKSPTLMAVEAEYTCTRCGKVNIHPTSALVRITQAPFREWVHSQTVAVLSVRE